MRTSVDVDIDRRILRELEEDSIYSYAQIIAILLKHGFCHRTAEDENFVGEGLTAADAKKAVDEAVDELYFLCEGNAIKSCVIKEEGAEPQVYISHSEAELLAELERLKTENDE